MWTERACRAPCLLSSAAVMRRSARKYGARSAQYLRLEAGHAGRDALLMAAGLGLVGAPVAAFNDAKLRQTLALERGQPLKVVLMTGDTSSAIVQPAARSSDARST